MATRTTRTITVDFLYALSNPALLPRSQLRSSPSHLLTSPASIVVQHRRTYVHPSTASRSPKTPKNGDGIASELEREKLRAQRFAAGAGTDRVGPFPLSSGIPLEPLSGSERLAWRDLGVGGKAARMTKQSANLMVIAFGAGLTLVIGYAITSELMAPNSPHKLYGYASELVKGDQELSSILIPPLSFHGEPSSSRMKRNRTISSSLTRDPVSGREGMVVHFWVDGKEPPEGEGDGVGADGGEWSWWRWTRRTASSLKGWIGIDTRGVTSGSRGGSSTVPESAHTSTSAGTIPPQPTAPSSPSWLSSIFGSLMPTSSNPSSPSTYHSSGTSKSLSLLNRKPQQGQHTTGEATAEFIKDDSGRFVLSRLFVDVPNSQSPGSYRVYVSDRTDARATEGSQQTGLNRLRFWHRSKTVP